MARGQIATDGTAPRRRPKLVSPSRIARFYYHECERYLRFTSTPREDWVAEGIPPRPHDTSPVTAAVLEGGYVWEEQVVERLGDRLTIADPPADRPATPVRDRVLDADQARAAIARLRPGDVVYQPTLIPSPAFYARYGIDPSVVAFTETRPDLIEALTDPDDRDGAGRTRLRVIDVKASPKSKLSHRIQAALYTLILRDLLVDWGLADRTVADDGGIWLVNADEPETFDLRGMLPPLETFLEHELQPLMERPAADARWHVWFRCEWCPYFEHCRDEMRATDDISRFPYLSVHAKRYLGELDPPVRTIADFEALLADPARVPLLDDAASLRRRPDRLAAQVRALRSGSVELHGGHSLALPKAEHVRVILTLQTEPVSGQVYAWGLYAQGIKDITGESPLVTVRTAPTPDTDARDILERALIGDLHGLLAKVDGFNRSKGDDWKGQKSLQVYVYDGSERAILNDILVRRIADPAVAEQAVALFFHFQRPELVEAEVHPATEVFFPVVVLAGVLRSLAALPAETVYRFADAVRLFPAPDRAFELNESDFFSFKLSNHLRSDAIFHAWHRGRTEFLEAIERQLRQRLYATTSLVNGFRATLEPSGTLFAWPPKFSLPAVEPFGHTALSRLAFITRYEEIVRYLALRGARMAPLKERLRSGLTLELEATADGRFGLVGDLDELDLDEAEFPNWILSPATPEGERAILAYDDFRNRDRMWPHRELAIALAGVSGVDRVHGRPDSLRLKLIPSAAFGTVVPGRRYRLDDRYTDHLSKHVLEELRFTDAEDHPAFVRLVDDPSLFGAPLPVPAGVRERALALARGEGMTASQLDAFAAVLDRRLRLVWGPPGTGKTHFLALAILCLAEAHRFEGRRYQVLVTAFTHAAIDNCLRKVAELQAARRIVRGPLRVGKLARKSLDGMDAVEIVYDKVGAWPFDESVGVVGGTVWALRKGIPAGVAELLVIDEGSQLTVPATAIAVRRLARGGRLVVAGDHRQLPPIVQGAYPEPTDGEPPLHRSIFEALTGRETPGEPLLTSTLLENWRSNRTLCRYPAAQIYVPEYTSATPEIAARRIALAAGASADELPAALRKLGVSGALVEDILDPEASLVVGILDGVRATAENRLEAGLVAGCALELRRRLLARDGAPYPPGPAGDRAFWTDGLFVVSPHHAQIRSIERALRAGRAWAYRPFVDTVDKMQGQESDAVIVSYGVSDVEYAMSEKEFIYSLNRLNVSITRGRAKTIVFLPRPLIEPPIQAFEDDRIAEGVAFMQGLVRFATREGRTERHRLASSAELTLIAVRDG